MLCSAATDGGSLGRARDEGIDVTATMIAARVGGRRLEHLYQITALDDSGPRQVKVSVVLRTPVLGDDTLELALLSGLDAARVTPTLSVVVTGAIPRIASAGLSVTEISIDAHRVAWTPRPRSDGSPPTTVVRLVGGSRRAAVGVSAPRLDGRTMIPIRRRTGRLRDVAVAGALLVTGAFVGQQLLAGSHRPVLAAGSDARAVLTVDRELESVVAPALARALPEPVLVDPRAELLALVDTSTGSWIVIPKLAVVQPILRGTSDEVLAAGVGHYVGTARPGRPGNVGIAGHRTSSPAPFRYLDQLAPGDEILLVVRRKVARYVVEASDDGRGFHVVLPTDVGVLRHRGYDSLTLTTCTPVGSDAKRLIVHARFDSWSAAPEESLQ